ncbi:MauE/DoxX family redox-associated membrane protein [Actinomadura roseirufa]|uniref:MauE/DoxX family redox-associated membrane protein n=1 Tax=Actinomadura roseirufa TaxID=2094049 RepID=UPI0010419640|nr:MauE/DoxX family redox-associated membrane protein [Actinomadura roseirufa]
MTGPVMGCVVLAERAALGTVFTVAVTGKLRGRDGFARFRTTVERITGLAGGPAHRVAVAVLTMEVAAVLLLLGPLTPPAAGLVAAGGLLAVFTGAVVRAMRRGVFAECACFGERSSLLGYPVLVRNVLLLAITAPGLVLAAAPPRAAGPLTAALAITAGACAGVLFVRYYDALAGRILMRWHPSRTRRAAEPG